MRFLLLLLNRQDWGYWWISPLIWICSTVPGLLLEPDPEQCHRSVEPWVGRVAFSHVWNWFPAQLLRRRVGVEYPTRGTGLIWTHIKDENNAGNRLGDGPQETMLSAGVIIKARVHKQLIQPHGLLPRTLEHCQNFSMAKCSPEPCQECNSAPDIFCSPHFRLGTLLWHLHRWHWHLLAQERRGPDGVTTLPRDVLRRPLQHHQ